jgi:hypothetical protein
MVGSTMDNKEEEMFESSPPAGAFHEPPKQDGEQVKGDTSPDASHLEEAKPLDLSEGHRAYLVSRHRTHELDP